MQMTMMTLYEMTKKYGEGKGESAMWKTVSAVSDAVEQSMPEAGRDALKKKVYAMLSGGHYNREFAEETVRGIKFTDKAGREHQAPYWPEETVMSIYEQVKTKIPDYNCWDFYVALNMAASDNWCLLNEWFPGITDEDRDQKFVELTVNWLDDPDNPYGTEKIWRYFNP